MTFCDQLKRIRYMLRDPEAKIWERELIRNVYNDVQQDIHARHKLLRDARVISVPPSYHASYQYDWEFQFLPEEKTTFYQALWSAYDSAVSHRFEIAGSDFMAADVSDEGTLNFIHPWEAFVTGTPTMPISLKLPSNHHTTRMMLWDEEPIEFHTKKKLTGSDNVYVTRSGVPYGYWRIDDLSNEFVLYPRPSSVTWSILPDDEFVSNIHTFSWEEDFRLTTEWTKDNYSAKTSVGGWIVNQADSVASINLSTEGITIAGLPNRITTAFKTVNPVSTGAPIRFNNLKITPNNYRVTYYVYPVTVSVKWGVTTTQFGSNIFFYGISAPAGVWTKIESAFFNPGSDTTGNLFIESDGSASGTVYVTAIMINGTEPKKITITDIDNQREYIHCFEDGITNDNDAQVHAMYDFELAFKVDNVKASIVYFGNDIVESNDQTLSVRSTSDKAIDVGQSSNDLTTVDNVLIVYDANPRDIIDSGDASDYPSFLQKYIEYGVISRCYGANTDGRIDSLAQYWKYRYEVGLRMLQQYAANRKADRDYRLRSFAPRPPKRYPTLPSTIASPVGAGY